MDFKELFEHSFIPIERLQKHLHIRGMWAISFAKQLNMRPDIKSGEKERVARKRVQPIFFFH